MGTVRGRLGEAVESGVLVGALSLLGLSVLAPAFPQPWLRTASILLAGSAAAGVALDILWSLRGRHSRPSPPLLAALAGLLWGGALGFGAAPRGLAVPVGIVGAMGAMAVATVGVISIARRPALRRVLLAGALIVSSVVVGRHGSPVEAGPRPIVVVGLDGGSWRIIDPLLARGELPTLGRFVREGASGILMSMEPTASPVVWTTIATGRVPEEHGVHDFYALQNRDLRAARFWEVASAHGATVGIFQWLITWPPDSLPGFVVPAWLARDERTHPPELGWLKALELRVQERRSIEPRLAIEATIGAVRDGLRFDSAVRIVVDALTAWRLRDARATYRAGRYAQLALVGDVFLEQYRRFRPEVAAVVFYGSDALSHAYWAYHEPDDRVTVADRAVYGETINEYYRRFDAFLGRLLDTVATGTRVVVVSDHGFRKLDTRELVLSTSGVLEAIPGRDRLSAHAINRKIYLTHRHADGEDARAHLAAAEAACRSIRVGDRPLLRVEGSGTAQLVLELEAGIERLPGETAVVVGDRIRRLQDFVSFQSWSGGHEEAGIILARGPGIRAGVRIDRASVLDIAPSVLAIRGEPLAADMDGRVLAEIFEQPPAPTVVATHDSVIPRRESSQAVHDRLEDRLRALGYVR